MPHLHLRGKSFRFEAIYPDGRHEVLLDVPRYEFDWQNVYVLAEPKPMPEGTIMRCVAHFDNSADNANNPDPTRKVTFGEQTKDEMLVGYMDVALDYQNLSDGPPKATPRNDGKIDVTFRHHPPEGTKTALPCFGERHCLQCLHETDVADPTPARARPRPETPGNDRAIQ